MSEPRKWDAAAIRELLDTSDRAVVRAIVVIHGRQTASEQVSRTTQDSNGVGFNAFDAEFLSSLAESAKRYGGLTPRQIAAGRKSIRKYAGQLADVANNREAA